MAENYSTGLPAGITVEREWPRAICYIGDETAMLAAGIVRQEWIEGLGRFSRQITLLSEGGFAIVGEGKGCHVTKNHKEQGAYSIKRLKDGRLSVTKYRNAAEEKALEEAQREKWKREQEQEAWSQAKEVRIENDYPERWKQNVLAYVDNVIQFLDGKLGFNGFPDVKVDAEEARAAKETAALLASRIKSLTPRLNDVRVVESNIIQLNDHAYRRVPCKSA